MGRYKDRHGSHSSLTVLIRYLLVAQPVLRLVVPNSTMNLAPDIALIVRATDQADAPGRPPQPVQLALKIAAAMCESLFGDETLGNHRLTMPAVTVFMVLILIVLFHRGGKLSMNRDRSGVVSSGLRACFRRSSPWFYADVV